MKYRTIIIVAVLFASFKINAQIDKRIKITVQNGKYGLTHEPSAYSSNTEELVEHKFDTILYPFKNFLFDMYNWPLITRIGDKYGILLHYKVGITDNYHDSFAVLPAIYDSAYFQGFEIKLIKNNKWGYLRYTTSLDVGYTSFNEMFFDPFYDNFYLSPIEYDIIPNYYYYLLKKNGKYGFFGNLDNNIPCEYDTLIYLQSKDCSRSNQGNTSRFRWTSWAHVTGWRELDSAVEFIKAVKGDKFTFLMVKLPGNNSNCNTFNYRQVLPWYSDSVDVRMARETGYTHSTNYQYLFFIITEPNKASYMIYPYDNNFDKIKMFNLNNSAFRMDSSIKYYNCDLDTLITHYDLNTQGPNTEKKLQADLDGQAYYTWEYFNDCFGEPTICDINKHIYILKRRDTNIAFVYRNVHKYFKVPYNPCGTDLFMICTKVLNSSNDSVIFTLHNSQTNDTIYQGIFPYNDGLNTSQLYINYPDYWDDRTVYYSSPYAKTEVDNLGLKLELYYSPDKEFESDYKMFDKSENKKYYYKLGIINTCEMKFYPNIFKFLQKKPWEIYKRNYYYERCSYHKRNGIQKQEYDAIP